ncbi:MAG: TetR/AcrR family transcriptional regulator [Deltaproteobacteria bacterium]|nr:TetR/AcrR family transcriptional regulator [Deltaproteobacteria bacterium]
MAKESTRDRIFKEAVCLFAAKGFHGTSMRDLAKQTGIKESSIYNHFKGKESILDAILEYQLEGFSRVTDGLNSFKEPLDKFTDPVEFWMGGVTYFLKKLPSLNDQIFRILHNEMYLNEKCRNFYLHKLLPMQKELALFVLSEMEEKGMIELKDKEKTAERYVYFLEGMGIEHNLMSLEGKDPEEIGSHTIEHIKLFIEGLK